jgi:uncharacterized protein
VLIASSLRTVVLGVLVVGLMAMPAPSRAQDVVATCTDTAYPYAVVQIDTLPRLDLEVARTPQEHQLGLGDRDYVPPDSGMLFVYQAPSTESYWMFHTLIPLSIAWIDRDGSIVDIQDMALLNDPYDMQEAGRHVYTPSAPYWYALEVNEGWFVQHGVGVGQQIALCLGGA